LVCIKLNRTDRNLQKDGTNRASSSDTELGYDQLYEVPQIFGVRFPLNISHSVAIIDAVITFIPDSDSDNSISGDPAPEITISVENTTNSVAFSTTSLDPIQSRSWVSGK
jgi:hypothetical protein